VSIFKKPIVLSYLVILGIFPPIVILLEASTYEFPTINYFLGGPYNPWPEFWQEGFILAIIMILLGSIVVWLSSWNKLSNNTFRLALISIITLFLVVIIWVMIGLSVETVVLTYMASINANPLHYLGRFSSSGLFFFMFYDLSSSKIFWIHIAIGCLETIGILVVIITIIKQTKLSYPIRSTL